MNADRAIFFIDYIAHRDAALELEVGEFRGLGNNHLEHRGLRHDARTRIEAIERNGDDAPFAAEQLDRADRDIRRGVELLTKAGFVQRSHSRRHQDLAAKLAREIGLSFEQRHLSAASREQVSEQGTCRSGTDDDCIGHLQTSRKDFSSINVARPSR